MLNERVLVTGASGFVGSAVARRLLAGGYRVRVLLRETSRTDNLVGLDVDRCTGDVRDASSLVTAMQDCQGVFHVAADYRLWTPDMAAVSALYQTNVEGSRKVVQVAGQLGIRRLVYTSSVATLGANADRRPADETTAVALADMIGHYKRSKYLAERVVRDEAAHQKLDVVIVHPAAPVGPRDIRPTPTGRMVLDAARGRMPVYVDTGLDIVHVDDVAEGHRLAYEKGEPGRGYILGGENLDLRRILTEVAALVGRHPPWMQIPHCVVTPSAVLAETWARVSGREPAITRVGARLARHHMYFSHQRAAVELGYQPRPARAALADAVAWFAERHRLRAFSRPAA